MQNLQILIDQLTKGRNLHISILDLTGILNTPLTGIEFKNMVHSKRFCDIAKSTNKGYRACLHCKMLANTKAIHEKMPFCGHCVYGLFEAAFPVVINGDVFAVVYVGNAVISQKQTIEQINKICRYTAADSDKLNKEIHQCENVDNAAELLQIAELVADYLKLLYAHSPPKAKELHWLVSLMKCFADEMYCSNISLKELAVAHRKNEKYIGRLFQKELGISFHEYLIQLRLSKAEAMLFQGKDNIIDIAFDCGFNTISYFNRCFKEKHGITPKEYRIKMTDYAKNNDKDG